MKTIHIETLDEKEAIIHACHTCFVGMCDSEGMPYVIPMNFVYREQTLYFHSAPVGRHLDILSRNANVKKK